MSALPPKADIVRHDHNVRFVPKADIRWQAVNLQRPCDRTGSASTLSAQFVPPPQCRPQQSPQTNVAALGGFRSFLPALTLCRLSRRQQTAIFRELTVGQLRVPKIPSRETRR